VQRRHEVRPDEVQDEQTCRAEADKSHGHRGHRPPEDEAGEHTECEREQRVRRHHDSFDVEAARADPPLESVERRAPPHHHEARGSRRNDRPAGEEGRLREQPAPPADGLCPGEAVGTELELARDQRGPDEDACEQR